MIAGSVKPQNIGVDQLGSLLLTGHALSLYHPPITTVSHNVRRAECVQLERRTQTIQIPLPRKGTTTVAEGDVRTLLPVLVKDKLT